MTNHYKIPEPFVVSFSGGRTSGFMLRHILDAHHGIPEGSHVLFANTGKEHEKTLEFVQACSDNWGVPITWLEYDRATKFRVVDFNSCSRNGEPFAQMIAAKKRLPSPPQRFCTTELKLKPIERFLDSVGCDNPCMAVGLRADEPHRVHRLKGATKQMFDHVFPLYDAKVTAQSVLSFWKQQPFDLGLSANSPFINCDLCFLKRTTVISDGLMIEPERANWWIEQEEMIGHRFRYDRPSLKNQLVQISIQGRLPFAGNSLEENDAIDCNCTD